MMRLQDLPFDVLHQIWQLVSPYDFEACALTCKFLYASAEPLLQRHNALRKQYRRFRLPERNTAGGVDTSLEPYTLPQLLCDIAADPVIAEYIVHVDLEHREALNGVYKYDENGWEPVVRAKMEARSEALWQLMRQSPYFAQLKVAPSRIRDWFNCILLESADFDDGQCIDFAAAFLLSLLPNLQSLELSRDWMVVTVRPDPDYNDIYYSEEEDEDEDDDGDGGRAVNLAKKTAPLVRKFIHYVIELANREDLAGQPLSKLHTLHPTWAVDTQFGDNIASIFPFLTLKSLRRVFHEFGTLDADDFPSEGINSDNVSEADGDDMSNEEGASEGADDDDDDALDEDEEDDDDDDDEGASQNGQDGDASEEGEQEEEEEEEHDEGSDSDADQVEDEWRSAESGPRRYDALGATVEHMTLDSCAISPRGCRLFFAKMERLVTLQYRHHTMESFGQHWDADAFMQSLASTPASLSLEKLALLAGMVWDDGLPIRSALHGFRSLRHLEVDGVFFGHNPNWTGATPALHGLLPPSLRTFVLHISTENYECVEDLFRGFRDERSKRLPLLEGVELRVRDVDFMGCPVEEHQECLEKIQSTADLHGLSVTLVSSEEHSAYQMT